METFTYDSLLTSLYKREPPLWLTGPALARFWLDSDKRILDVGRILWLHWPLAAPLANAHLRGALVRSIAGAIPAERHSASDLKEAVYNAFLRHVMELSNEDLANIFLYDDVRFRRLRFEAQPDLPGIETVLSPSGQFRVVRFTADVLELAKAISLYERHHAPLEILAGIFAKKEQRLLLISRREGEIFARDVSEELRHADFSIDHDEIVQPLLAVA